MRIKDITLPAEESSGLVGARQPAERSPAQPPIVKESAVPVNESGDPDFT